VTAIGAGDAAAEAAATASGARLHHDKQTFGV
jgi:hypothetical protein